MTDDPSFSLPPEMANAMLLSDYLMMHSSLDGHAGRVAAKISKDGLDSISLLPRDNRDALREIFDVLDNAAVPLLEPDGALYGPGLIGRLSDAVSSGSATPKLMAEVMSSLKTCNELADITATVAEGQDGELRLRLRAVAASLRFQLNPPPGEAD